MDDSLVNEHYPLTGDHTFLPTLHQELLKGPDQWTTPEMFAAVQFTWAVLLRECAGRTVFTGELTSCNQKTLASLSILKANKAPKTTHTCIEELLHMPLPSRRFRDLLDVLMQVYSHGILDV